MEEKWLRVTAINTATDQTCPECKKEMAIIFLGDGTAYDECECGTQSEIYRVDG